MAIITPIDVPPSAHMIMAAPLRGQVGHGAVAADGRGMQVPHNDLATAKSNDCELAKHRAYRVRDGCLLRVANVGARRVAALACANGFHATNPHSNPSAKGLLWRAYVVCGLDNLEDIVRPPVEPNKVVDQFDGLIAGSSFRSSSFWTACDVSSAPTSILAPTKHAAVALLLKALCIRGTEKLDRRPTPVTVVHCLRSGWRCGGAVESRMRYTGPPASRATWSNHSQ